MEPPSAITSFASSSADKRCAEGSRHVTPAVRQALQQLLGRVRAARDGDLSARCPVSADDGIVGEIGQAFNDILDQLATAKEAADKAKSELLANVSHEIRTPLGVVLGYSELLLDPRHTDSERQQWIGAILRNGRQLSCLIDDMLALSQIEASRLEVDVVAMDVSRLLFDVTSEMALIAARKGIGLRLEWQTPPSGPIESDPTRLRQILRNVIGNAVKFTDRGEVAIFAETRHDPAAALVITVSDTGSGIAEAQLARLFQPFTQADGSSTRRFGGTGMGLGLSRRLAVALGGDLELRRTELGKGSAFAVTLPIQRPV